MKIVPLQELDAFHRFHIKVAHMGSREIHDRFLKLMGEEVEGFLSLENLKSEIIVEGAQPSSPEVVKVIFSFEKKISCGAIRVRVMVQGPVVTIIGLTGNLDLKLPHEEFNCISLPKEFFKAGDLLVRAWQEILEEKEKELEEKVLIQEKGIICWPEEASLYEEKEGLPIEAFSEKELRDIFLDLSVHLIPGLLFANFYGGVFSYHFESEGTRFLACDGKVNSLNLSENPFIKRNQLFFQIPDGDQKAQELNEDLLKWWEVFNRFMEEARPLKDKNKYCSWELSSKLIHAAE